MIILDKIHKFVKVGDLNNFRLEIIKKLNNSDNIKKKLTNFQNLILRYFSRKQLAIQKINLTIPIQTIAHLFYLCMLTRGPEFPLAVVVWFPLVDCYKTKTM